MIIVDLTECEIIALIGAAHSAFYDSRGSNVSLGYRKSLLSYARDLNGFRNRPIKMRKGRERMTMVVLSYIHWDMPEHFTIMKKMCGPHDDMHVHLSAEVKQQLADYLDERPTE